jgi:hypothetical protein
MNVLVDHIWTVINANFIYFILLTYFLFLFLFIDIILVNFANKLNLLIFTNNIFLNLLVKFIQIFTVLDINEFVDDRQILLFLTFFKRNY